MTTETHKCPGCLEPIHISSEISKYDSYDTAHSYICVNGVAHCMCPLCCETFKMSELS
jgi:hypothetical protein